MLRSEKCQRQICIEVQGRKKRNIYMSITLRCTECNRLNLYIEIKIEIEIYILMLMFTNDLIELLTRQFKWVNVNAR